MKAKYQKGGRKAERVQNRKDAKANRKKFKKFGTPLNKKSINSFRQKGGKVKTSLKYKPGFPTTGDKPSPYDLKTLKKAIARDSTTVADRGMIGDFFDPGVTSGSTGPSDQYNLQINREYRDKVTGSDSEQTAKKINKMKKQTGGPYTREQRKAVKKSGKAMKKHGRKLKRAGSQNKMAGFEKEGDAQIEAGMAFKKEGRNRKKMSRKMRDDNFIIENKELVFGKPSKKRPTGKDPDDYGKGANPSRKLKGYKKARMQKGGAAADSAAVRRGEYEANRFGSMNSAGGTHLSRKIGYSDELAEDDFVKDSIAEAKKGNIGKKREDDYYLNFGKKEQDTIKKGTDARRRLAKQDEEANKALAAKKAAKKADHERQESDRDFARSKTRHSGAYQKGGLKTPTAKQKGLKKLPTSVRNKMGYAKMGGMKYGKGGMKDKKFLGGLAGAIGGAKGGGGLKGMLKGAMGGGMLGRGIGAIKGAMGGGGLKGAMQGLAGGAFGNSNPMAQQQAQGADPAMAQQAAAAPAAQDPAMQDPAAQQMAQRGGQRRRNRQAKNAYKKSVNRRGKTKNRGIKLGRTGTRNCIKGDC